MVKLQRLIVGLLGFSLMACVTVNIYFPAAAAEQAADKIIKDVYGTQSGDEATSPAPGSMDEPSGLVEPPVNHNAKPVGLIDVVLPVAYAEEPDLTISTPGLRNFLIEVITILL